MIQTISVEEALKLANSIIIDTRTPKEFELDHLPNAINIPLLNNDERAVVGTLYKQKSQNAAITKGFEFFEEKFADIIDQFESFKEETLIIHCWRGGMRSRAVAQMLEPLGYNVLQLEGGYKAYRAFIRGQLEQYKVRPKLVMLHGLTGTGKTKLLKLFSNHLDLEGMAQHRGSLYGGIGLSANNQKNFENLLWQRLEELKNEKFIIVEGESKRIGKCIIPAFFWRAMKDGVRIQTTRSIENRAKAIAAEYFDTKEKIEEAKRITLTLRRNISNKSKKRVVECMDKGKFSEAVTILLNEYYDPLYSHTLKEIHCSYSIATDDVEKAKEKLTRILK